MFSVFIRLLKHNKYSDSHLLLTYAICSRRVVGESYESVCGHICVVICKIIIVIIIIMF